MFEEVRARVDQCLGECYYMRGMLYFYFVRAYGRPYYQAADRNLGVPVVNGTPRQHPQLRLLPLRPQETVKGKL